MLGPVTPLFGVVVYLLAASKDGAIFVVFGRPGAGKTTVANSVVQKLQEKISMVGTLGENDTKATATTTTTIDRCQILGLDLDVCVPDWMKENFSNGIYPTLEERKVFAEDCCDYVEEEQTKIIASSSSTLPTMTTTIVSFSFVNTDLRDIFRSRFPHAEWVLVDTTPNEANRRIQLREGHFYNQETSDNNDIVDPDNDDWNFAPVTFPHVILDGNEDIEVNADNIVRYVQEKLRQKQ